MPQRLIREGILMSERVDQLSMAAEVFYRRLMSVVDDYGRYYANSNALRAQCYPLRIDRVTAADVESWLQETVAAGLLQIYEVDRKRYVEIFDFRQQVRSKSSKFPDPEDGHIVAQEATGEATVPHGTSNEKKQNGQAVKTESTARTTARSESHGSRLPDDWQLPREWGEWALQQGVTEQQIRTEAEKFYDYWRSQPGAKGRKADWQATWRNWIRRVLEGGYSGGGKPQGDELTRQNQATLANWSPPE